MREWLRELSGTDRNKVANNSKTRLEISDKQNEEYLMNKKNIGSSFDDFLEEEAILDETTAVAIKRVIAWQIDQEMKVQKLTKSAMVKKMHTSRSALNRLLDENDTSLTLTTLSRAASVLGKRFRIELES